MNDLQFDPGYIKNVDAAIYPASLDPDGISLKTSNHGLIELKQFKHGMLKNATKKIC